MKKREKSLLRFILVLLIVVGIELFLRKELNT